MTHRPERVNLYFYYDIVEDIWNSVNILNAVDILGSRLISVTRR